MCCVGVNARVVGGAAPENVTPVPRVVHQRDRNQLGAMLGLLSQLLEWSSAVVPTLAPVAPPRADDLSGGVILENRKAKDVADHVVSFL